MISNIHCGFLRGREYKGSINRCNSEELGFLGNRPEVFVIAICIVELIAKLKKGERKC